MDRYCSYLGTENEIRSYLTTHNIHEMIIALDVHEHDKLLSIIGAFNLFDVSINIIPDMYLCCCGGGGLISGSSLYLKHYYPNIKNYSVEPENFNDTQLSLENKKIVSNKKLSQSGLYH